MRENLKYGSMRGHWKRSHGIAYTGTKPETVDTAKAGAYRYRASVLLCVAHARRCSDSRLSCDVHRKSAVRAPQSRVRAHSDPPDRLLTATKNGRILRINTIDTLADGVTPDDREAAAAALIRSKIPPSVP
jgi:hypothetical protein